MTLSDGPEFVSNAPKLLHEFFEATVLKYPNNTAIEWEHKENQETEIRQLNYRQVKETSDRLTQTLTQYVTGEDVVAIMLPRKNERIYIAQLAAMKAGGAYLCIDHVFPDERITFTLSDASPVVIVTDKSSYARIKSCLKNKPTPIIIYEEWERSKPSKSYSAYNIERFEDSRLAYLIYTSGSTGQPKGVLMEHRNAANLIRDNLTYFKNLLGPTTRVANNSSAAYDSSVEEIYFAFSHGGTIVVMDEEVVRMGPDLPAWLAKRRVNLFMPPPTLLRSMGGARAAALLTDLHLLYVGGEALTSDIVDIWAKGRHMENAYGPTECGITITRGPVFEGVDVTIGRLLPNNTAYVLDDKLNPVGPNESGELCVSGINLARGYLNRDKLTAEKFLQHPVYGRIYRTGDLVQKLPSGEFLYFGRIDSQVKLRGYRVELSSIESHLSSREDINEAACVVQMHGSVQKLIAFVTTKNGGNSINVKAIKSNLSKILPPYMIPSEIKVLDFIPRTISEKIDRVFLTKLKDPAEIHTRAQSQTSEPNGAHARQNKGNDKMDAAPSPVEEYMAEVITRNLNLDEKLVLTDDFFQIGGDSLTAAIVVSEFRENTKTSHLAVKDIYEQRSVRALATLCGEEEVVEVADLPARKRSKLCRSPVLTTFFQFIWILFSAVLGANWAFLLLLHPWRFKGLSTELYVCIMPFYAFAIGILWIPISIIFAVTAKAILIGRYKPGRYPVWGAFYFRHWICKGFINMIPWGMFSGTEFHVMALRALGAKISKNVHLHRGVNVANGGWDLLTIGENVTLGRDVGLRMLDYEDHEMVIGEITIGDNVTMETRAGLCYNSSVGQGAYISALSVVTSGNHVPSGTYWEGVPGQAIGKAPAEPTINRDGWVWSPIGFGVALVLQEMFMGIVTNPIYLVFVWDVTKNSGNITYFNYKVTDMFIIVAVSTLVSLLFSAVYVRLMTKLTPGVYHRRSQTFMSAVIKDIAVTRANQVLSGTLFWPTWLRIAGMKIGYGSEVSSIFEVIPELVTLGEECFFADGIYLGGPVMHGKTATLGHVSLSKNTFLGNHVIIPTHARLPADILIGVNTVAPLEKVRKGSSWFGNPTFELPRREKVEVSRDLTHNPSIVRYITRLTFEMLRFIIPLPHMLLLLIWCEKLLIWRTQYDSIVFYFYLVPLISMMVGFALVLLVWALKWILVWVMREGQHPLYSCWCSRWDFMFVAWQSWARPVLTVFEGTLILNSILRCFGVRIGRRVFLGPTFSQVTDPDLLHFGDNSTVTCGFQAHSFEDRVLKKAPLFIRRGATVKSGVTMMYGSDVGEDSIVGEHSVIMKRELLLPKKYHIGCPTRARNPPNRSALTCSVKSI